MDRDDSAVDAARVDELFAELLDLEDDEGREARLSEVSAEDEELGAKLRKLLALAEEPEADTLDANNFDGLWSGLLSEREQESDAEPVPAPDSVGPWRLIRELGRGGMGTVYLGERADGEFQQEAAIKLVHTGEQNRDILRRFELERQILAGLSHPNIAQLLDGGRSADGQPYFAMEFVRGRAIKQYCDDERLTVTERLKLFLQVGRAVEHAHRSLVVHRDLKPSNIVVTEDGKVKLLDFGIAKLLGPSPMGSEPMTGTLLRVLTPEYASPEQIQGSRITTASDVYQLGLLLYELLTGRHAHRLKTGTLMELERAVCEEEPTRPSTQVTSVNADPSSAWSRSTQPQALARKLRGDLDNIVLLALRKEPEKRYASVSQLIDDVERYLEGLPVSARPPTLGYRASKFLRRHALATSAALAFVLLLLGYAATTTIQARQIRHERDRAEIEAKRAKKVSEFLVGIFHAADPYRHKGDELTAGELVEAGSEVARSDLADEPEVLSDMLVVLGSVSNNLGAHERAQALLTEGLDLALGLHPEDHPDVARTKILLASALTERGKFDQALELAEQALETYRRVHGEAHPDIADGISAVGAARHFSGDLETATEYFREEVAMREQIGDRNARFARALNNLGTSLQRQSLYGEAETNHRRALGLRRFLFAPEHPAVSESLNNLAVSLRRQQRLDEAEPLYREALEIRRKVFGDRHLRVSNTLNNLGELLRIQDQFTEAETLQREALSIRREVLGEDHSNVAFSLHNLASIFRDSERTELAEDYFRQAEAMLRRTLPPGHHATAYPIAALGRMYLEQGQLRQASSLLEETLEIREAALGNDHELTAEVQLALGTCRARQNRTEDAVELLQAGLATLELGQGRISDEVIQEARDLLAQLAPSD